MHMYNGLEVRSADFISVFLKSHENEIVLSH